MCRPDGTFGVCICTGSDAGAGGDAAPSDAPSSDAPSGDAPSSDAPTHDASTSDAGADGDASSAGDAGLDGEAGTPGDGGGCPEGMVAIGSLGVCIDRYEASKGPTGLPESKPGRMPWVMVGTAGAAAACKSAGKRLCDGNEWLAACHGPPPGTAYPYGDTFAPKACNGIENYANAPVLTGSMAACVGGYPGIFDMSGNVSEMTSDCDGGICPMRGGFFIDDSMGLRCDRVMNGDGLGWNIGFRCCLTLP